MGKDVDAEKFVSPPYCDVMECTPTVSVDVLNVATPPDNVPVSRAIVSSMNVTEPFGVPAVLVTVTVKVTKLPDVDV
jgi:hypothetical protein